MHERCFCFYPSELKIMRSDVDVQCLGLLVEYDEIWGVDFTKSRKSKINH